MSASHSARYDAVIIGTGQGGKPLALALARAGWRTAIIERAYVGGTCVNVGCTPTKTMVASARIAYLTRRAADYGISTGPVGVDLGVVRRRKQSVVESFRQGSQQRLEEAPGLDLIFGEACFDGPRAVKVKANDGSTLRLEAERVLINVGCRPSPPHIEGLEHAPILDSSSIMELDVLPDHLLIIGGGYIGVEFGQMFRRFGSRVTIVHRGRRLLAREDPDVADAVASILREDGLELKLLSEPLRGRLAGKDRIELTVRTPDREEILSGSHLLGAVGRVPNTDTLDLASAGVRTDERGYVVVNDRLETSVANIYCLGDANGGPAFTHVSYDDFRILRTNLLEGGGASTGGRLIPYTVFMDPQLGRVGLSETQARGEGKKIRIARLPMERAARAIEVGETRGFVKAVVDAETGQILGCAVLGIEGGELMSAVQIAMIGKVPEAVLREAIFAHPTLAESLNTLFTNLET